MTPITAIAPHPMPGIEAIDFGDVDDVAGYAALITARAQRLRLFGSNSAPRTTSDRMLVQQAREWTETVRERIGAMSPGAALALLAPFDIAHRIAYRTGADTTFTDRYTLSAFNAHIQRSCPVDEYTLYRHIRAGIRRRSHAYLDRPLRWSCLSLDRWVGDFTHGEYLGEQSDSDIMAQTAILLGEDLYAFKTDQMQFKNELFQAQRHYLDETARMTPHELMRLGDLLNASANFMAPGEHSAYRSVINRALATHPATNRFFRASLDGGEE